MTVQTSIVLPDELVAELDRRASRPEERSALVAEALRCFFATHRSMKDDLEVLNLHAEELNREAEDVLDYQVIP
jgi:metal-responsive CopG/Arc/MetJ family transcriptional regulator